MLYHYPSLSHMDFGLFRTPGPGLGNMLFPIMRAAIGAELRGGEFVYPTFAQVKLGTIFRRERDKRFYADVARSRHASEWGTWFRSRRPWSRVDEAENNEPAPKSGTIVYSGLRHYFHDLADHADLVCHWYNGNMRVAGSEAGFDVALHIRQGDFVTDAKDVGRANTRTPFHWYRNALDHAAKALSLKQPRILLFTDGDFSKISAELDLPNIEFDQSPHAAAAIARMSRARMIVTSRSTFSMWGAFLGSKPAIWDKAFGYQKYFPHRAGLDISL